jgi:hypothetical protein
LADYALEPDAGQCRREEVAAVEAPEDRPGKPRKNAGSKKHGVCGITAARSILAELMNRAELEAAARQGSVDRLDTERQHGMRHGVTRRCLHHPAKLGQWYRR